MRHGIAALTSVLLRQTDMQEGNSYVRMDWGENDVLRVWLCQGPEQDWSSMMIKIEFVDCLPEHVSVVKEQMEWLNKVMRDRRRVDIWKCDDVVHLTQSFFGTYGTHSKAISLVWDKCDEFVKNESVVGDVYLYY